MKLPFTGDRTRSFARNDVKGVDVEMWSSWLLKVHSWWVSDGFSFKLCYMERWGILSKKQVLFKVIRLTVNNEYNCCIYSTNSILKCTSQGLNHIIFQQQSKIQNTHKSGF
ncbi:hypothetical protein V6Z12_D11G264700 [Gossypium hirsutum]